MRPKTGGYRFDERFDPIFSDPFRPTDRGRDGSRHQPLVAGCWLVLALAQGLPACQSADDLAAPDAAAASAGVADVIPEPLPEVVVRVNRTEIGCEEFERAIRSAEVQAGQAVPSDLRADVYRAVLDRLVAFHLLIQESQARNVLVDDAKVEAEIANIQAAFPSEETFEAQLSQWRTPLAALQDETRKDLLIAKVIEQEVQPKLTLDEAGVREFYDQLKAGCSIEIYI